MKLNSYHALNQQMISHTCGNGLKICVFPKAGFKRAYAMLAVNYGSIDISFTHDGELYTSPLGVAHFLEHKVFEQPDGGNALQTFAKTGASPNAFTSKTMTAYHFSGTEKFMKNLEILLDFVMSPYFTDENVRKEQGIIGQEIGMVNDRPSWRVYENLMSALYSVHPAKDSIIGTVGSIGKITREILFKCYNTFYVPSNMTLCVAGDVSAEKIISTAESMMPRERISLPSRDYGCEPYSVRKRHVSEKCEVAVPMFAIGAKYETVTNGEQGMKKRVTAELAADVLGGPSSPLYSRLYGNGMIGADFESSAMFFPNSVSVILAGEGRDAEKIYGEVLNEAELLGKDIDDGYFNRVKKAYIGSRMRALDDVGTLCREQAESVLCGFDSLDMISAAEETSADEVRRFIKNMFECERTSLSVVSGGVGEDD